MRVASSEAAPPFESDEATDSAAQYLRAKWGLVLDHDPYYNRNFDSTAASFRLPAATEP
jgi:hypothetical protein